MTPEDSVSAPFIYSGISKFITIFNPVNGPGKALFLFPADGSFSMFKMWLKTKQLPRFGTLIGSHKFLKICENIDTFQKFKNIMFRWTVIMEQPIMQYSATLSNAQQC